MKDHFKEGLSLAPKIRFFELFNKKAAANFGQMLCDDFQAWWQTIKGHNRGGVVASTIDTMHAILGCLAATMEDLRENQPELYIKTILTGEYFVFVNRGTISSKINQGGTYKNTRTGNRTAYNQINRLLEVGFLVKKLNYSTKVDKKTGELLNPYPEDLNPNGNGRIQLFLNPDVFQVNKKFARKFEELKEYLMNTFPIEVPFTKKKNNKVKIDSTVDCGQSDLDNFKAVLATANGNNLQKRHEQAGQLMDKSKFSRGKKRDFRRKKYESVEDVQQKELLGLCNHLFFPQRQFTETITSDAHTAIALQLNSIEKYVHEYRADKVKSYTARDKYQNAKPKTKNWMLKRYYKRLPSLRKAALEILAVALGIQRNHAQKKGYLHKIQHSSNDPVRLFTSSNLEHAIGYALRDWRKQTDNYFANNDDLEIYHNAAKLSIKAYSEIIKKNVEKGLYQGFVYAVQQFKRFKEILSKAALSESSKKSLVLAFTNRLTPLYKLLQPKEKSHLYSCAITNYQSIL
ncbi:MAG: hypothetical protein ACRBFS_19320 [Aureispira sp.]